MKPLLCSIAAVLCCVAALQAQPLQSLSVSNELLTTGYRVVASGPDTRVWSGLTLRSNEAGGLTLTSNTVVELGLFSRWDQERAAWIESTPEVDSTDAAVLGRGARHEVEFAGNLNTRGAISVRLPATGGTPAQYLKTHVLGLAYACGGTNFLLAQVKDSPATVVGKTRVLYQDAFDNLNADLLYSYSAEGLAQFVILRAQPPSPESLGLDADSVKLVAITEIAQGPEPRVTGTSAPDPLLEFGSMSMTHGRAFLLRDERMPAGWQAPHVLKRYEVIRGRRFIFEGVDLNRIQDQLLTLPPSATSTNAGRGKSLRALADATLLPAPPEAAGQASRLSHFQIPQVPLLAKRPGFVLDWDLVHTTLGDFTFESARTTTYILRHPLHLTGRTVFQPGAVILVQEGPLHIDGTLEFAPPAAGGGPDKVVFTTLNDPEFAGPLNQRDLPQEGAYGPALVVPPGCYRAVVRNIETRYAVLGVVLNLPVPLPTVAFWVENPDAPLTGADHLTLSIARRGGDLGQALTVWFRARVGPVPGADVRGVLSSSATIPANEESVQMSIPISRDPTFVQPIVIELQPDAEGSYLVGDMGAISLASAGQGMQILSSVPAPAGMVAWWQGEGDGIDASGNAHHATTLNQVNFVAGEVNQAFSFNGASSYVAVPNISGLNNDLTIEFWVKRQRMDSHHEYIIEQGGDWYGGGSQQNFAVAIHGGDSKLCFTWAGGYRMGGTITDTTTWHHCAVVARHGEANPVLYIDGAAQTITDSLGGSINLHATSRPLHIGAQVDPYSGWNYYGQTLVDELTIYNACLTAPDIQAIYNAGPDGKILCAPPAITTQPQAQTINQGGNASFTVLCAGSPPLVYQWYKNDDNHPVGGDSCTLTIQNVQTSDAGTYYVKVSNCGGAVTSSSATLTVNPALPPCATLPANLRGWWKAEGDVTDASGNNYNGTFNTPAYASGVVGQAFSFNGSSSYATVTGFPDITGQLTIELWVKRQRLTGAYELLVEKGGDWSWGQQNFAVQLHGPDNDVVFSWGCGYRGAGVINDYAWHHCAVVATAGQANPVIYIDGVARTITLWGGSGTITLPSFNRPLHIGAQVDPNSGWNYYGNTFIDELSIYNRALSAAEIQAIYNAGASGKCQPVLPPTITTQPQSQTVAPGANVTFTVAATGTAPLYYQWFHSGAAVPGATGTSLALSVVQLSDSGEYKVTVANVAGAVTSSGATLTVSKVSTPVVTPAGASYPFIQDAVLSCATPGAVIHYTLNGLEPAESDPVFGSPILIDHELTLKAKAWKTGLAPSDTLSESYVIEASASRERPVVTISPPTGTSFLASEDIDLLVEASDSQGSITSIELFRDGIRVTTADSSPLRYTLPKAFAGTYAFTARAVNDAGFSTVTAPVTYTVNASGPVVSIRGERPLFTFTPGTLLANVYGVNPGGLSSLTLNGALLPLATGDFSLTAGLTEGNNTFTLVATDTQARTAQASTTVSLDSAPPSLTITAPANNASFGTTRINVLGTFAEASLKRIIVNGVLAFVSGSSWEALNLPLAEGANTITATAEDLSGNTSSTQITVNGTTPQVDPVQLTVTPVGGFAPLQVTLQAQGAVPGTIQQVLYDVTGDHSTFQTEAILSSVNHTYSNPGEFFPVVTVVSTVGRFSSAGGWNAFGDSIRVNVQAPSEVLATIAVTDPVDLKWMPGDKLYVLSRSTATLAEYDVSVTPASLIRSVSVSTVASTPNGLDVDNSSNVYVAVTGDHVVKKFKPDGTSFALDAEFGNGGIIGSYGAGDGQFNGPFDVATAPNGQQIAVSDSSNHRVQSFTAPDGRFIGSFGQQGNGSGQFNVPKGLTYDQLGTLYVVDSGNNRVVLTDTSAFLGTSGSSGPALGQFQGPINLSVASRGIYVADTSNSRVQAFDALISAQSPPFTPRFALASQTSPPLTQPRAVTAVFDLTHEKMYIADTGNNRILLVQLPLSDTPEAVWNAMKARLVAADIAGAIPYFANSVAEDYRRIYLTVGTTEVVQVMSQIPAISPIFIEGNQGQYYFEEAIDGETITFPIHFIKENGLWKITEY